MEEVGRCVAVRAGKGDSTWITFVGDSNQRQKIHSFLDFLPPDLTYSFYLGDEQVREGKGRDNWEAFSYIIFSLCHFLNANLLKLSLILNYLNPSVPLQSLSPVTLFL